MRLENFGPARVGERLVFGGAGPDPDRPAAVRDWLDVLTASDVERMVCLLGPEELRAWGGPTTLLDAYAEALPGGVLHVPLRASEAPPVAQVRRVMGFLEAAEADRAPTLIHCALGRVRTPIVLAAWLVHRHQVEPEDALEAVARVPGLHRDPLESESYGLLPRGSIAGLLHCLPGPQLVAVPRRRS
jgi:hypothetical protein